MRTALAGLLVVLIGCNEVTPNDPCADNHTEVITPCITEVPISGNSCILKAAVGRTDGVDTEKWVYYHNGTHYTKIEYFSLSSPTVVQSTATMVYDNQERITRFDLVTIDQPGLILRTSYAYDKIRIRITVESITSEGTHKFYDWDQLYVTNAKDSLYIIPDDFISEHGLQEYRNGNTTRQGFVSTVIDDPSRATCEVDGHKYLFKNKFYFDNRNNVLKDFVVRYPFDGRQGGSGFYDQFFFETNHNNAIAVTNYDGIDYKTTTLCYTFAVSPSQQRWLQVWNLQGKTITYEYDCK